MALPDRLYVLAREAMATPNATVVALTGAGVSAESGIPTFRGPEGYWTVGSAEYHPHDLATSAAFAAMPDAVWGWYLHRRAVCQRAQPNAAHHALAALERALDDRFLLVTQNVDGLHARAGQSRARTYAIHGDLGLVRCAAACGPGLSPLPAALDQGERPRGRPLAEAEATALRCPGCGGWLRPHVLWFDEYYDEQHFRFDSSLRAVEAAALLVVVGTSGSTNLPNHMCRLAAARGTPLAVLNRDPSPFSALAERSPRGCFVAGDAAHTVPALVDLLRRLA